MSRSPTFPVEPVGGEDCMQSAAGEKQQLTDEDQANGVDRITFPATDTVTATIMGKSVQLRPLVIKQSKRLTALCDPAFKAIRERANDPLTETLPELFAPLVKAYCYIAQCYGLKDCSEDWVEEHLQEHEVTEVIELQLSQTQKNSSLQLGLRGLLALFAAATTQAATGVAALPSISETPVSTPASVTPGTASSTSS